jgi:hypothetical protein
MTFGLSCSFGERSRPFGRAAHQKDMAATCRTDETQSSRRDRSEAQERRSLRTNASHSPGLADVLAVWAATLLCLRIAARVL